MLEGDITVHVHKVMPCFNKPLHFSATFLL